MEHTDLFPALRHVRPLRQN